jgi:hypothetical protein
MARSVRPAGSGSVRVRYSLTGGCHAARVKAVVALVLVAAALAVPAARATPHLELGLADSTGAYFDDPSTYYAQLAKLHVRLLRVQLHWGGVLGVARKRPQYAFDPADPAYDWSRYDDIVLHAQANGIAIVFTIFGTPRWANGGRLPTRAPRDAGDLEDFAYAAADRYSGDYARADGTVLPPVKLWTAWNEPNLPIGLVPQWRKVGGKWRIQSAIDYARICNAVAEGVHATLIKSEQVACGDTAPRGNNAPTSTRPTTSPLAFIRAMKEAGAKGFDAFAHHPYPGSPSETPTTRPKARTAVTFGNLDTLVATVTKLWGRKPIWIDEYGYETNPPDWMLGVSLQRQAQYLTESVAIARRSPRITMLLWFLLEDEPRLGGWQSGLETATGKPKPAFAAFARAAAASAPTAAAPAPRG